VNWQDILKQPPLTPEEEKEVQSLMRFRNMDRASAERSVRRKSGKMGNVRQAVGRMVKEDISKKDKKDMRVGRVYTSDRPGKKIMMLTHEGKKIHAGAKGYGNYKGKGKNRGGGTHTNKKRRANFKARHNCDQCKGRITTPKCLACKKLW
jgi:hypothetical protein